MTKPIPAPVSLPPLPTLEEALCMVPVPAMDGGPVLTPAYAVWTALRHLLRRLYAQHQADQRAIADVQRLAHPRKATIARQSMLDETSALLSGGRRMTAAEFRATLRRLGLTQARVAALLGVTQPAVSRWSDGTNPVPGPVAVAIKAIGLSTALLRPMLFGEVAAPP